MEGIIQLTSTLTPTPIPKALTAMIEETKKEEDQNQAPPSSVIRPEKKTVNT